MFFCISHKMFYAELRLFVSMLILTGSASQIHPALERNKGAYTL